MSDETESLRARVAQLEGALRVALRRLDGRLWYDRGEDERRPAEGEVAISRNRFSLSTEVTLPGVLTRDEATVILDAIDDGSDQVVECDDWEDVFAGNVAYLTAAGHRVEVFNDCGARWPDGWDYVASIVHADGRRWEYADDGSDGDCVGNWSPVSDDSTSLWFVKGGRRRG